MMSKVSFADFWKNNNVDFTAVAADDADDGFEVTKLPGDLPYPQMPKRCPRHLREHYTVRIDRADVYHGTTPVVDEEDEAGDDDSDSHSAKKPRLDALLMQALNDDRTLELDLFKMLQALDDNKSKNFSE